MELSAVLSLRDKLSAQMNKASKSVSAMTEKVNESRAAITRISGTQGISITARSNISDVVSAARTSISSLQNTISGKELTLEAYLNDENFGAETIEQKLSELSGFLDKNAGKFDEYNNKLAVLKQKQSEFTDSTKGSTRLGIEQSIDSLEKKLAEIEEAKQRFAEWQQVSIDFNELEQARSELATLEHAVEELNSTNVAVRAYVDFKNDALQQVYDIDKKLKKLAKFVCKPIVYVRDRATAAIRGVTSRARAFAGQHFSAIVGIKDKAQSALKMVQRGLARVAGTVAYPIIKLKDAASPVVRKIASGIKKVAGKVWSATVKIVDKTGPVLKSIGSGIKKVMGLAAKGIVIGATATLGGAAAATSSATSKQKAVNSTLAQTGYNAEDYKAEFSDIMSNLYQNNMGESYEDLGNSLSQVSQITNATGKDLEGLTHNALLMRDTFGYDVTESVRSAKMMMDQFGISGDEAYNLIAEGTQNGLNKNGDLLDTLNEYGVHFKQMGFSSTEMMNMLSNGAKTGTFSVDKLGDSIKEFGIRTKDGSDGTKQAFKDIGLDAAKLTNDFAAGGERGKAAFQEVTAALAGMKDPVKQNAAGVALFGTMWEDLGADGVLAMSQLNGSIEGGTAALEKINQVKYDDLGSAFGSLKRTFTDAVLNPIGEALLPAVTNGVNTLRGFASQLGDAIKSGDMSKVGDVFNDLISSGVQAIKKGAPKLIQALFKGISGFHTIIQQQAPAMLEAATSLILALVMGLSSLIPSLSQTSISVLQTLVTGIIQNLPMIIQAGITLLESLAQGIMDMLPTILQMGIQLIMALAQGILQMLPTILSTGLQLIMSLAQGLIGSIPTLVNSAVQIVLGLVSFILSNLPMLLEAALSIILALVQGLVSNIPIIIDGAIQILLGLVNFILSNLPLIIQTAIEVVFALAAGLIQAIPELLAAIPQLISAIIDTIMNTDWLEVGWNIVKGIGGGLLNGIKSLFGCGDEAAEDVINGLESGLTDGVPTVNTAATNVSDGMVTNMQPNLGTVSGYGTEANNALASGITGSSGLPTGAAANAATNTSLAFAPVTNTSEYGNMAGMNLASGIDRSSGVPVASAQNLALNTTQSLTGVSDTTALGSGLSMNLASGIDAGSGAAITAATSMSDQVKNAANTDVMVNISANADGLQTFTDAINTIVLGATTSLQQLPTSATETWGQVSTAFNNGVQSAGAALQSLDAAIKQTISQMKLSFAIGMSVAIITVASGMGSIVATVGSVSLYGTGQNIMQGLNNGMLSMRGELQATARSIASGISNTINSSLDIHSPSRVTTQSGKFAAEGLVVGMKQQIPQVTSTAETLSDAIVQPMEYSVNEDSNKPSYEGLDIAQPVSGNSDTYNNSSNSHKVEKKYYIDKIIGEVTITGEGDEDRLVQKFLAALADDIDETADNMGEEDYD